MKKATREQTRAHNKRLILRTIYEQGEISRADIARATSLTRTTVSHIVSELIDDRLIEETGRGPSEGGKPPVLLRVLPDARCVIGVDLANSEFRGGIIDLRGNIVQRYSLPVDESDGELALQRVYTLLDHLHAQAGPSLAGIGIGTPGLVDGRAGIVRQAVNLDWRDLPMRDLLAARYGLPIYVANDSHAAALAEFTFGHQRRVSNLVVVKAGRGISAGIVLNGRLHYGDGSGAGEIGHVRIVDNGVLCRCGNTGCLETVASTRAIISQARDTYVSQPHSLLRELAPRVEAVNTTVVLQAFEAGDQAIIDLIVQAGRHLGYAVAHLVSVLNVQEIIIAGSLARFGPLLLEAICREMGQRAMAALAADTRVSLSHLGEDIVLLGAASLLLSNELGVV